MATVEPYLTSKGEKRYRVRYRTPDHRQTDKRGFKTKKEAELFLASTEISKHKGEWVDPSKGKLEFGPWAETWYSSLVDIKPTTLAGYRQNLNKHVLPKWQHRQLASIGHAEIQTWVSELSKTLSASTTTQVFLNLRSIIDFAIEDGRLSKNPCSKIRLPRITKTKKPYLSNEQVIALAEECENNADIILTLAYTGMRWGELAALKVESVDFAKHRISVASSISEVSGKLISGTPKSHENRSIPFPDFLTPFLRDRCAGKSKTDHVFSADKGGVLRSSNFRRSCFNKAVSNLRAEDPDFPKVTPHNLRDTAASLSVSAGANVKSIQRMLGHARASMTLDTYAELFEEDLDAVSTALNNIAGPAIVGKLWAKA